jgi:hypothetical protein
LGLNVAAENFNRRCKARAKSGKPCRAAATAGGLCFFHANPDKASELGRIGGRSNRHAAGENADPLPTLDNAIAVRDTVARLIADVYAGRINLRIAAGLAPLLNLQLRAIETTDLERRLTKLEKLAAEATEAVDRLDKSPIVPELDFGDLPMPTAMQARAANGVEKS